MHIVCILSVNQSNEQNNAVAQLKCKEMHDCILNVVYGSFFFLLFKYPFIVFSDFAIFPTSNRIGKNVNGGERLIHGIVLFWIFINER